MNVDDWKRLAVEALDGLRHAHHYRFRRLVTPLDATHVEFGGRRLVNFASNDYLGLSHHPAVIAAASEAAGRYGAGSGASPLVTGYTPAHHAAEKRIAQWKQTQQAVLLPSGYQANHAAVGTIAAVARQGGRTCRFLLDKLCHASLIDAVRASEAPFRVFPHNGLRKLEHLLEGADADEIQVVVTESIFSMDGDAADLAGLGELKGRFGFVLLLDEAHSSGVYGEDGCGLPHEMGLAGMAEVTVVTLSKAVGCAGGAVCGSSAFCESVINFARPYIFSTAVAPAGAAGAGAAIEVMAREPWRRERVRGLARRVRSHLAELGYKLPAGDSPIIPIVLGDETAALKAAERLMDANILCLAIRPPTVAKGASRLRVTLSAEHRNEDIAGLLEAIAALSRGHVSES